MMSGGAGAPCAAHAVRIAARTVSAVSAEPPAGATGPRMSVSAAAMPASAARCARRMPSSSAGLFTRRRPSTARRRP